LKLEEALDIAIQTARGLEAAHDKAIVHRDIKSANLMLTSQGQLKIMDFGLAQLADRSKLTKTTTLLGTPAYMSPEQALREPTDLRTDVWSLGVVLYEMLTGHLPFEGEREQAVLYAITNEEPEPVTALRSRLPTEIDGILEKALAKKPEERYQHVADLLVDLQMLKKKVEAGGSTIKRTGQAAATASHAGPSQGQAEGSPLPGPLARFRVIENLEEQDDLVAYRAEDTQLRRSVAIRVVPESEALKDDKRRRLQRLGMLAMVALAVLSLAFGVSQSLDKPSATDAMPLRKFSFTPLEKLTQERGLRGGVVQLAVSPNGGHVAFVAGHDRTVWIRDLANEQAREIEGTQNALFPFWSPDSEFVGFGTESELKKISLEGTATITICELSGPYFAGGDWSPSGGSIVFASGNLPLKAFEVPSQGGDPKLLFEPDESEEGLGALFPQFLPRGTAAPAIMFSKVTTPVNSEIVIKNLETGERFSLGAGALPRYSSTGHIVYQAGRREGGLWALPFSIKTLQATGEAFPIARNARSPSVADDGTLVYADITSEGGDQQLVWIDREGTKLGEIGQPQRRIVYPNLSPDERRVAAGGREGGTMDIWIHATDRPLKTRFTFAPAGGYAAAWTPSGKEITFTSQRSGNQDQFIKPADGSSEAQLLVGTPLQKDTPEWSRDGRYFVYNQRELGMGTLRDLVYRERQQDGSLGEAVMLLQTEFEDAAPKLSPDGRFVVYTSNDSGRFEVYVRSFPDGTGKRQVSTSGGTQPRWSRDGKEIFYVDRDTLMAVGVTTSPSFSSEPPEVLFAHPGLEAGGVAPRYDVANDGQRFVLAEWLDGGPTLSIHVVQNWFAEFKDREQN
jgi:WD40 repeat protein